MGKRPFFQLPGRYRGADAVPEDRGRLRGTSQSPRTRGKHLGLVSKPLLAAAVSIHSVEARHAAWMRHLFGVVPAKNAGSTSRCRGRGSGMEDVASTRFISARAGARQGGAGGSRPNLTGWGEGLAVSGCCGRGSEPWAGFAVLLLHEGAGSVTALPLPARARLPPSPSVGRCRSAASNVSGRWTTLAHRVVARAAPSDERGGSRRRAWDADVRTGTANVVLVLARRVETPPAWSVGSDRDPWGYRRGGTTAWVPRRGAGRLPRTSGRGSWSTSSELRPRRCSATAVPCSAPPVGVGRPEFPTPAGGGTTSRSRFTALRSPFLRPACVRDERPLERS